MSWKIIGCPTWRAKAPTHGFDSIVWTPGPAKRIILHHTAGHHAEISVPQDESLMESIRYAQDIQAYHQHGNGWNDSGHNFLVCRNGVILQGRWRTIRSIQAKKMVVSAHCPGQNDQIGIEHEHISGEKPTLSQINSSAWLQAWVAAQYGLALVLPVFPHREFFATECPSNLVDYIPEIKKEAQRFLNTFF